jgi:phage/plasmid-associated DNA primase
MANPSYVKVDPEELFKRLINKFGLPGYHDSKGKLTAINERFFAELLAAENHIVHEAHEENFYAYNPRNGLWERNSVHALKSRLSNRIRQADRDWQMRLSPLDTEHNRRNIISLLRGVVERTDFFLNRPHAIHAANSMLVFENGGVVPKDFGPEFLSRNQLTVAYKPEACCPRFEKELLAPALCPDDLAIIKKMFGLLILGRNRPQRIFILLGAANTGKTTTGLIAEGLIG